jgi:DNA-binding CsgD family transcriptional regulator
MREFPEDVWLLLDLLPLGVVMIGDDHRVAGMNARAQAILREADAVRFDGTRVRAADALLDAQLQSAVANGRTVVLRLRRFSQRRPMEIAYFPLSSNAAVIVMADPERAPLPDAERLRALYGLTPTEGRVVAAVVRGDGGEAAARALNISVNTFRRHLKSIFVKVGVERQSELVRIVCCSVAALGSDPGAAGVARSSGGV